MGEGHRGEPTRPAAPSGRDVSFSFRTGLACATARGFTSESPSENRSPQKVEDGRRNAVTPRGGKTLRFPPNVTESSPSLRPARAAPPSVPPAPPRSPSQPLAALLPTGSPAQPLLGLGTRPQLPPAPHGTVPDRPFLSAAGHMDGEAVALRTQHYAAAAGTGSEAGSPHKEKMVQSP